ncbi:MAG: hypothetical protein AB1941_00930 [Gemmatimonadota bacterium]
MASSSTPSPRAGALIVAAAGDVTGVALGESVPCGAKGCAHLKHAVWWGDDGMVEHTCASLLVQAGPDEFHVRPSAALPAPRPDAD